MKIDMKAYAARHPLLAQQAGLTGQARATVSTVKPGEAAEQALYASLTLLGIEHEPQYRWHPTRKWASDAAIPEHRLLVEIDGEIHRVHRDKWLRDMERQRAYTELGWACLRFTPEEAKAGTAALEVQKWLAGRKDA